MNDINSVRPLLDHPSIDVNARDEDGFPPLCLAVRHRREAGTRPRPFPKKDQNSVSVLVALLQRRDLDPTTVPDAMEEAELAGDAHACCIIFEHLPGKGVKRRKK